MDNPRDTQFAGFAAKLLKEIDDRIGAATIDDVEDDKRLANDLGTMIARRAYDLMQHVVGHSLEYLHECGHEMSGSMNSRIEQSIPDLANFSQFGFPEENEQ